MSPWRLPRRDTAEAPHRKWLGCLWQDDERRILEALRGGGLGVEALGDEAGLPGPVVRHHLQRLEESGLVVRDGASFALPPGKPPGRP